MIHFRAKKDMAMGHNLWRSHFGGEENPFATYFDVHHEYRVLTHSHMEKTASSTKRFVFFLNSRAFLKPVDVLLFVCFFLTRASSENPPLPQEAYLWPI